jgi:hypothetical protein
MVLTISDVETYLSIQVASGDTLIPMLMDIVDADYKFIMNKPLSYESKDEVVGYSQDESTSFKLESDTVIVSSVKLYLENAGIIDSDDYTVNSQGEIEFAEFPGEGFLMASYRSTTEIYPKTAKGVQLQMLSYLYSRHGATEGIKSE